MFNANRYYLVHRDNISWLCKVGDLFHIKWFRFKGK